MVASAGASMPAPLAIPPTFHLFAWCSDACFGTVSVVMIAYAASVPPEIPPASSCTTSVTPGISVSMGKRSPISPVEQTARSEEHTSELQSLMRISYAVFCLKKKKIKYNSTTRDETHQQNTS